MSRTIRLVAFAFMAVLALSACSKKGVPDNLGLNAPAGSTQDFAVNVGDRVFFTVDSSTLSGDARATLDKQATWLQRYPTYRITIEGHADERGTREYNIALGARRAAATRDYLVARGIPTTRMRTISYGKERPVAVGSDLASLNQNRRAVTVLSGAAGG
jgi:peptidoglycan-associated lipoprotein